MPTTASAGTQRKPALTPKPATKAGRARDLEQSLLALESACMHILESQFVSDREDVDGLMWQRKFKNIVTPISLALREYKGPRRFHYHYRHREDDETVLHPVMEDPMDTLALVCASALAECRNYFVGIQDAEMIANRDMLEQALRKFLQKYKASGK